ncbi:hypothetical protein ACFLS9_05395 [Bacteroidota bacterium]
MYKNLLYIIFPFFVLSPSCDAPHTNPLDPQNTDGNLAVIEGSVKSENIPRLPIPGVEIFWSNSNILDYSDANGQFKIKNLIPKDGWLLLRKSGFSSDSLYITWIDNKKISIERYLNANPALDSAIFSSIVVNKYPSNQKYSAEFRIKISDVENDIDSVIINNEELNFFHHLDYNLTTKFYEDLLSLNELNINSLDEIIGKNFQIIALDKEEEEFSVGDISLKRIIKQEIVTISPAGRDTVEVDSIVFKWLRFNPGFEFNYQIQVYTDEIPAELVWERQLPSSEIEFRLDISLTSGDYFWVIWGIDEFYNKSRSKPFSFIIK